MTPEQNAHVKTLTTREEIFEHVAEHLKNQDARSMQAKPDGSGVQCAYRGAGDRMCAVGCLLADDEYDPGMENLSVTELSGMWPCRPGVTISSRVSLPERLIPHRHMLADLQSFHDLSANWSSTKGLSHRGIVQLRSLRRRYLSDPAVPDAPPAASSDSN